MVQTSFLQELLAHENIHNNLSVPKLVEKILCLEEGSLSATGAIRTETGEYTGRSPKDRFIVKDDVSEDIVDWGQVNQPIDEKAFQNLYKKVIDYLKSKDELFSFKGFAGADEKYRLPVQVINEHAWQNLFARQMLIRPTEEELNQHKSEFTVLAAPSVKADPT